jgi:hypothetical protein
MENTQSTKVTTTPTNLSSSPMNNTVENGNRFSNLSPRQIGTFLAGILLVSLLVFYSLSQTSNRASTNTDSQSPDEELLNIAPYTVMYGSWTDKNSVIFGYDLTTGKEDIIAQLPRNIKKVTVIDPNTIIYISQTDRIDDRGRAIAKYDLTTKKETVLFQASDEYGIDDYMISSNNRYISILEFQDQADSGVLLGGKSRVYTADLSVPNTKNLIADEVATAPVLYPRAILNNGTVFMDRFMPNSSAGWAYGMRISNFIGTSQRDIPSMQNGTFSSQPVISPDESRFAFLGYDGSQGDGKVLDPTGFRIGLIYSNTVEILDTQSLERIKLTNIPSSTLYSSVSWKDDNTLSFNGLLKNTKNIREYYEYSLARNSLQKVDNADSDAYLGTFGSVDLYGTPYSNASFTANLGTRYSTSYQSLSILKDGKLQKISAAANLIQYIATVPRDIIAIDSPKNMESVGFNQLRLQTFNAKVELDEERKEQQSDPPPLIEPTPIVSPTLNPTESPTGGRGPRPADSTLNDPPKEVKEDNRPLCVNLAVPRCNAAMGRSHNELIGTPYNGQLRPVDLEYHRCLTEELGHLQFDGSCQGTPLYLYGPEGLSVDVTIHAQMHNAVPRAENGKYSVKLGRNGSFTYLNNDYTSIAYDYNPAIRRLPELKKGYFVTSKSAEKVIREIAGKFGFNEKETNETVRDITAKMSSEYAFISFYDHETSHAILPITFNPKPEVYRNIAFYIKNLDSKPTYSIQPPVIEKINRYGFTAIEISHIVE